jgi:hypothetical protein
MIEIEILLTFVYFLECTVVQCKDALSIYWNRNAMNARESENYLLGNDTSETNAWLNLQKIGGAVIWNYFRIWMLKVIPIYRSPKKCRPRYTLSLPIHDLKKRRGGWVLGLSFFFCKMVSFYVYPFRAHNS